MSNCLFSLKKRKEKGDKRKEIRKDIAEKKEQVYCATDAVLKWGNLIGCSLERPEAPTGLNTVTSVS